MKRCLLVGAAPSAHKELDYILQTQGFDAVYAVDGGFAALQERGLQHVRLREAQRFPRALK